MWVAGEPSTRAHTKTDSDTAYKHELQYTFDLIKKMVYVYTSILLLGTNVRVLGLAPNGL